MKIENLKFEQITKDYSTEAFKSILDSDFLEDNEEKSILLKHLEEELKEVNNNRNIYLVYQKKKPIAYAQLILKNADNNPSLANGVDLAHLHNLRVHKEKRGQGIGKVTVQFLEKEAKKLGFKTLTLGVDHWNSVAIQLYKNLSYQIFRKEEGRFQGEKLLLMKKKL